MDINIRTAATERSLPHRSIAPLDLRVLLRESDAAAARMVRKFRLPTCEHEDLRQEILVDLLGRIRKFDPKRGTFGAFVGVIAGHRAARLTKSIRRERVTSSTVSLDEPVGGPGTVTLGDTITEGDVLSSASGQPFGFTQIDQRFDLSRALSALEPGELVLCAKLIENTPTEVSRSGECSRAGLYRRLKKIRLQLLAEGVSWP